MKAKWPKVACRLVGLEVLMLRTRSRCLSAALGGRVAAGGAKMVLNRYVWRGRTQLAEAKYGADARFQAYVRDVPLVVPSTGHVLWWLGS